MHIAKMSVRLPFKEKDMLKAGFLQPSASDLTKRVHALYILLQAMDQDDAAATGLIDTAKDVASAEIANHARMVREYLGVLGVLGLNHTARHNAMSTLDPYLPTRTLAPRWAWL